MQNVTFYGEYTREDVLSHGNQPLMEMFYEWEPLS